MDPKKLRDVLVIIVILSFVIIISSFIFQMKLIPAKIVTNDTTKIYDTIRVWDTAKIYDTIKVDEKGKVQPETLSVIIVKVEYLRKFWKFFDRMQNGGKYDNYIFWNWLEEVYPETKTGAWTVDSKHYYPRLIQLKE